MLTPMQQLAYEALELQGLCDGAEALFGLACGDRRDPDTKKARNALHVYLPLLAERAGALNTALEAEERRQQAG
ncbi:MAG: hypothetical protein HLUCCO18_08425 [Rhodobacteraceae bacterium HLUCCO18]|nr:MAG: hypothetical protein HLUCCO18_08425 [Rhodobacteraceae bacterium HLUCCO18]